MSLLESKQAILQLPVDRQRGTRALQELEKRLLREAARDVSCLHVDGSPIVDLEDDVGRRLLTETAFTDSERYEVLPCDEADRLKRHTLRRTSLVDDARTNLAIQTKYRDALTSVAKLPSRDGENDARTMEEKARVVGRCEDLTMGLLDLKTRLAEDRHRLLEHTAGVLRSDVQQREAIGNLPKTPDHLCSCSRGQQSPCERSDCDYADRSPLGHSIQAPWLPEQRKQPSTRRNSDSTNNRDALVLKSVDDSERKLCSVNVSLHDVISRLNHGCAAEDLGPPPRLDPSDHEPCERLETQIEYLEKVLTAVRKEQALSSRESDEEKKSVRELFCVVKETFAVVKQKREERKMARTDKDLALDDGEPTDGEYDDEEGYSIGGFSDRVRYLSSQFALRSEQLTLLERQIKQQRELNNRAAIERNEELAQRAKLVAEAVKGQAALTEELKVGKVKVRELEERVEAEAARARNAESQLQIAKAGRAAAEAAAETLRAELEGRALEIKSNQEKIRENDEELEQLKIILAKAKTDAAIARAELDGAYGPRCAPDPAVAAVMRSAEYAAVQSQVDKLKKELNEARLQCNTDAVGGVKHGAGVTALSEQFQTTLSEERKKFRHALSEERAMRRKLEEMVDQLRAKQEPGGLQ